MDTPDWDGEGSIFKCRDIGWIVSVTVSIYGHLPPPTTSIISLLSIPNSAIHFKCWHQTFLQIQLGGFAEMKIKIVCSVWKIVDCSDGDGGTGGGGGGR